MGREPATVARAKVTYVGAVCWCSCDLQVTCSACMGGPFVSGCEHEFLEGGWSA